MSRPSTAFLAAAEEATPEYVLDELQQLLIDLMDIYDDERPIIAAYNAFTSELRRPIVRNKE